MERFYYGKKKKKLYCLSEEAIAILNHVACAIGVSNSTALEIMIKAGEANTMQYYLMKEEMIGIRPTAHNAQCVNKRFDNCIEKPKNYKESTKSEEDPEIQKTLKIAEKMFRN